MANATDPDESGTAEVTTQSGEHYTTRGQTRLATRHGHRFRPSDKSLPEITPEGVNVTAEQADTILAEAKRVDGRVYRVQTNESEG